jgi:hypothetical protein
LGILVALSVIYGTSCDQREKDAAPNVETATAEDGNRSEDASLRAQQEEARRKEELEAQREQARRNEEQQAQREEARRKEDLQAQREQELQAQREEVRRQARGEKMERLETQRGKVYESVTIKEVSPVGLSILHDAGAARIPFEDLPVDMQERFIFDRNEKENALLREQSHQNAHDNASIVSSPAVASSGKGNANSEHKKKVMMALASKEARIQTLQVEMSRIRNDIQTEEDKKLRRGTSYYYHSDGSRSYYRNRTIGGISRAPILRQELSNKEQELATLTRQVAMLRVELESTSQ